MDKEIVEYPHNGILINHKKGDNAVRRSIDGLEIIILGEVTEAQIPYDITYM